MLDLTKIKGIGPKTINLLEKLNIRTTYDLLMHLPFRYDLLKRTDLRSAEDVEKVIVDGIVETVPIVFRFRGGLNKLAFRLATTNGPVAITIFNRAFMKSNLKVGTSVIAIGKYDKLKNTILASELKFGSLGNVSKVEPVYHVTSGMSQKNISNYINTCLLTCGNDIDDYIPKYLLDKYKFSNKKTALSIIHNPPSLEKMKEASIRLKYEELFQFMFKINYLRMENNKNTKGVSRVTNIDKLDEIINKLPFELTNDQRRVLMEIVNDLNSERRMNRLLQGDVGSGKTIVAILAMYYNALCGYQSALMAPTEILATQHYNNIKELFRDIPIHVELLTGSVNKKNKSDIYSGLKDGSINIIIGTHALISEEVTYNNLGLVITDEQHRFGVNQRANLKNKGVKPDVLYMSATPIPRTYALTIYGDMDVSIIKEMPKGRKPVKTVVKSEDEIKDVLNMMYEELKNNHQVYVIAPLIEDSENVDLTTVYNLKEKMNLAFGSKFNIDIVHGKMKNEAKDLIMGEFKQNKVNILISTTVIEVGVDVPNATMIVIFDANRFGLSTLHQLRGRVGRSNLESKCILISNSDAERLKVMEKTHDGFVISEEDFKLRGSGDLFGTKQSGDMCFKIANLKSDYKILVQAKQDSLEFLEKKDLNDKIIMERLINSINNN